MFGTFKQEKLVFLGINTANKIILYCSCYFCSIL